MQVHSSVQVFLELGEQLPEEEDENGNMPFRFEYNIIDNVGIPREEFGEEFFTLIGDILVEIIDEQLEEENLEYNPND